MATDQNSNASASGSNGVLTYGSNSWNLNNVLWDENSYWFTADAQNQSDYNAITTASEGWGTLTWTNNGQKQSEKVAMPGEADATSQDPYQIKLIPRR